VEQEDSLQARSFVDERENEKDAIGDDHLSDEELQNLLKSLSIGLHMNVVDLLLIFDFVPCLQKLKVEAMVQQLSNQ